ncbi:ParB/RepB/Spo0J family partition protein [Streptomyces sp. NPDC056254]|uniref:ParB/RepB/Spo0J family partition protein n=1 Tax=Streptomyces sp. NPDC056254 TaxID=3345763 RepID=UPI0035E2CE3B
MTPPTQRVTRGFSIDDEGTESSSAPRRIRTRQQIMAGEGKRPPAAVPLSDLAHNPFNPREELTDVEETAESLRERGQLQPVAVVRTAAFLAVHSDQAEIIGDAAYVVIDGNRRLAAARVAGLAELRIDVNDALATSAEDILESALIANIHRVDVPALDQARSIQGLVAKHGSQGKVARRLQKSEAWVSQRLALLELPADLQEKVDSGDLPVKHARRIGRLPADQQHAEAEKALNPVKAPRKPRGSSAAAEQPKPAGPAPETGPALPAQATGSAAGDDSLNPVKGDSTNASVPDLPWTDPAWFNRHLRKHMSGQHRDELVLLLMADE